MGLAALAAGAAYAFKQFEDAENVMQQTDAVLKSTGGAANVTAKQVANLADELSRKAGVDDEVIQSGANMLLTFKNITNEVGAQNDIFNQANVAALDMAAAMAAASGGEIDLKAATIQLGKALNDPIAGMSALTRVGVQFSEEQQKQIERLVEHNDLLGAQKIILAEVTSQFGGSAEAQKTASGEMRVAFENLAEAVGTALAPAIQTLVGWVTELVGWFNNLSPAMQETITFVGAASAAIGILAVAFGPLIHGIHGATVALTVLAAHPIIAAMIAFGVIVAVVATKWDDLHGAIKVVLAVLSPFGVIIGLVIRNFEDAKEAVIRFGQAVVDWFERVIDKVMAVVDVVKGAFVAAWKAASGPVLAVISGIVNAVEGIISAVQSAIGWIAKLGSGENTGVTVTRGEEFARGPVPGAASGGFVARSGVAVIHKGENIIPSGGGGDVVLQIDGATFARISRDQLLKLKGSRVNLGLS